MKITGNEPLRFAVLTDTHVSPARAAAVEQLGRTYATLARLSPAGVHFIGFDPTQALLEPGHCGRMSLHWLDGDLGRLDPGTPVIMFQHFPVGRGHDYIDDQAALLGLLARHGVRGLFAGHIHRETVTRRHGLTQVTLKAFADGPSCYWAETARADGRPELTVSRLKLGADGPQERHLVARVPLTGSSRGRRPKRLRRAAAAPGWRIRLAGSMQGGIAAGGGTVVAASTAGQVAALRPEDGGVRWQSQLGPAYRRAAIDVAGRTVFVPSADRHLYALDVQTGRTRWRFDAGAPVLSAPAIAAAGQDEYVVFGAGPQLFALAAATGQPAWSVPGRGWSAGRAHCDGQRVDTCAGFVHGIRLALHHGPFGRN